MFTRCADIADLSFFRSSYKKDRDRTPYSDFSNLPTESLLTDSTIMADPYNPYTSYSTPTPGGVGYYPPEEQTHAHQQSDFQYQQPYGGTEQQPGPNYGYTPQPNPSPSPYHLTPEPHQGGAPQRSYTPVGQPDYLGPVTTTGMALPGEGKVPENLGY
jgi:hypothetical protein